MVIARTDLFRIANMDADQERRLHNCCNKFATKVTFHRELEYYEVEFTDENWVLAVMSEPEIDRFLKV